MFSKSNLSAIEKLYEKNETFLDENTYKTCVDLILGSKKERIKTCENSKVAKICLDFLRGFAYLAVAFEGESTFDAICEESGLRNLHYRKRLDDQYVLDEFFRAGYGFSTIPEEYGCDDDPTNDRYNSFVDIFYKFLFYCLSAYSDKKQFPKYNREGTLDYLMSLLQYKEKYYSVSDLLMRLDFELENKLEPVKKSVQALSGEFYGSVFEQYLQIEVQRAVPIELWEYLEYNYGVFLLNAREGKVVGPNLSVGEVAEILNCSPQRVYQLMDAEKIEFLPKNTEENATNQRMISYDVLRVYIENAPNMSGMEYQHSIDRLNSLGHLEVDWNRYVSRRDYGFKKFNEELKKWNREVKQASKI